MRVSFGSFVTPVRYIAIGMLLVFAGCGSITKEDLQKWSRNEEGLARIQQMMEDEDVPDSIRVDAVEILVDNNWAAKVKNIVQ